VFSRYDMVMVGAGEAPMPCLLGEGRSEPPSLPEVVWNSSVEFPIMGHSGDAGPLWVEPMSVVSEPSLLGESQAAEAVGDELEAPKANGFAEGEAITR
jgi:hypothetical protein